MTQTEILNSSLNKTDKMKALFELGLTRRQVSELLGVGYGFAQNVYAKMYGTGRQNRRSTAQVIEDAIEGFNFTFNRNFGVEIEAFNIDSTTLKNKLNAAGIQTEFEGYTHRTMTHWKVVTDASLRGNNTFELVSPILNGQDGIEQLKKVCKVLKSLNAKINKSCGLHIHFDARDLELSAWKKLHKNYANLEPEIDTFMPVSRRGNNAYYCKSIRVENFERKIENASNLKDLGKAIGNNSRFLKLNTQAYWRHQTVEFRQHAGSIEFEKISNWILFLARMVEFSKERTIRNTTFEGMNEFLSEDLMTYFKTRKQSLAA